MTILERLVNDHRIFLQLLEYLEKRKERCSPKEALGLKEVSFAVAHVVEKHAEVEETVLLPELARVWGSGRNSLQTIEVEHVEIRKILRALKETEDTRKIKVEAAKLIEYLRDHIAKEERVLFPLAEAELGWNRLEALGKIASRFEGVSDSAMPS